MGEFVASVLVIGGVLLATVVFFVVVEIMFSNKFEDDEM